MAGLFAHGCEKLRYKGEMQPSELLDPVSSTHVEGLMAGNIRMASV